MCACVCMCVCVYLLPGSGVPLSGHGLQLLGGLRGRVLCPHSHLCLPQQLLLGVLQLDKDETFYTTIHSCGVCVSV